MNKNEMPNFESRTHATQHAFRSIKSRLPPVSAGPLTQDTRLSTQDSQFASAPLRLCVSIKPNDPLKYYDQPITQTPEIPRSSDPWFYHHPEHIFVPSIPSDSCEPLRLFLIKCREADLAAIAELKAKAAESR